MAFDLPLELTFRSKIVGGKFYTLDGEKEVTLPTYSKHITKVSDLTPIEIEYILIKYSTFNRHLGQMERFIAKMKL